MKKFSQSVFLSDFNFIVVSYLIVPVAKFNIICERRTTTKLSIKTEHGDPTLSFYYYSSKYFRHRTKCRKRKKKRKLGKFLMLEICLKIRKMSVKKLIFGGLVTMATKVMTITIFLVACKKSSIHWLRVLTTLAFRVPYFSEFYFALTS